jgi:PAS domain-containing protein
MNERGGFEMRPRTGTDHLTRAGLNLIQQALSIYDADLRLAVCNRPFQTMFGLPERLVTPGAPFRDTIRYLVETGEYGEIDDIEGFIETRVNQARAFQPHYMERRRANGRMISVEGSPLPEGGWVTVYTDITAIKRQEELLRARSEELTDQVLTHAEDLAATNRALEATIAQLEEAKAELTEMEARIRLTTEMTPAHIARVDRDGVYTYTNRRLSSLCRGVRARSWASASNRPWAAHRKPPATHPGARALAGRPACWSSPRTTAGGASAPPLPPTRPARMSRSRGLPALDRSDRGNAGQGRAGPDRQTRIGRPTDQRAGA